MNSLIIMRQFLTPTEENKMCPRILSSSVCVFLGVMAMGLMALPIYTRYHQTALLTGGPSFSASELVKFVNQARAGVGLPAVQESPALKRSAEAKAKDMLLKQYFSHLSPDQKTPWDFFRAENYQYTAAGENLAIDFVTAEAAQEAFMASPSHRANILGKWYTEIGIGVVRGEYQGRPSIVIVEHFGKPRSPLPVRAVIPAKPAAVPSSVPDKSANIPPVATSPRVLGTETAPPEPPIILASNPQVAPGKIGELVADVSTRTLSFVMVGLVLLALAFLLTRIHNVPLPLLMRGLVLIAIFGYAGWHGAGPLSFEEITPVAFSSMLIP